jgi:hypothetical protein
VGQTPIELPIPKEVQSANNAIELARVWASEGSQYVSLATGIWKDPAAWGLMLVDLARHVAASYHETSGMRREDVLKRIKAAFDVEWSSPTS